MFRHAKLGIVLAIQNLDYWKIATDNSAAHGSIAKYIISLQ